MKQTVAMNSTRYRTACIWLAIATLVIAYAARAQAGIEHARAYTAPVIEFLAGHQPARFIAAHDSARGLDQDAFRPRNLKFLHDSGSSVWTPVLPILFIGLLFPLAILSPRGLRRTGGIPAAPSLPSAFQRPPPAPIA